MIRFIFVSMLIGIFFNALSQAEISKALSDSIQYAYKHNIRIIAVVVLKDQVNIKELNKQLYLEKADAKRRAYEVITSLQKKAEITQTSIKLYATNKTEEEIEIIESLWVINGFIVKAKPEILLELSERDDVYFMDIDHKSVADPTFDNYPSNSKTPGSAEIGLKVVNAHKLWQMGYTGAGRLVMTRDTGVDGNHPALDWRWRGTHVPYQHGLDGYRDISG